MPRTQAKRSAVTQAAEKRLAELHRSFGRWLSREDAYSDVVISSRVRLARNLQGVPFPRRATREEMSSVVEKVRGACLKSSGLRAATFMAVDELSDVDRKLLVERRLVSPQFIEESWPRLLVVDDTESISIMVNEEDHLRIQCLEGSLSIDEAWKRSSRVDDELSDALDFGYSDQFGYLTACPTNTGTGLRVSLFVHAPALSMKQQMKTFIDDLPEMTVRGFYGEGTEAVGSIFQVSNQLTLGKTEESLIETMNEVAGTLVEAERQARKELLEEDRVRLEDLVFRAYGILKYARVLTSLESMNLLATLRFGLELGILDDLDRLTLNRLMVLVQQGHLQKLRRERLNAQTRDEVRAEFVRDCLQL